jgi:lipoate-protein ligase B
MAILQSTSLDALKEDLFRNLRLRMGEGIVDVELDPEHYEAAYKYAVQVYRQRAQNATEEAYTLLTLQEHQEIYTLPKEFINVRQVFRRTVGM